MRFAMAGLVGMVAPGLGHAILGRRRAALLFGVPVLLLLAGLLILLAQGGPTAIVAFAVTPGVLPVLGAINVLLAVWRVAAAVDTSRATTEPRRAAAILGPAILILVLVPHLWVGSTIAATNDFLDSMFASGPGASDEPDDTPPPGWTFDPGVDEGTPEPIPTDGPTAATASGPLGTRYPRVPADPGSSGNLPGLGVAVPWQRPGAVPWGNDGRFDLLLLGSDAGRDRWSRRMDVMLLVEVDVATGKVAMIGLPRNLLNAPFPPGPAHDAIACGCFPSLLNALYVEATAVHPDRWPGTGAVAGIGAVRSVVSELTKRPVDGVLVADLWGVIKVVDAMGGIDMYVPQRVYDSHYPDPVYGSIVLDISAGQHHFDGRMALAYARSRHQDSDYGRMARQQTFLLAVRKQIGPETILNAPDLFAAAQGVHLDGSPTQFAAEPREPVRRRADRLGQAAPDRSTDLSRMAHALGDHEDPQGRRESPRRTGAADSRAVADARPALADPRPAHAHARPALAGPTELPPPDSPPPESPGPS